MSVTAPDGGGHLIYEVYGVYEPSVFSVSLKQFVSDIVKLFLYCITRHCY